MRRCGAAALLLVAMMAAACRTCAASRRLLIVCTGLKTACATACYASGFSYYSYDCNKDNCRCSNSAVNKCFPGSASVRLRGGERKPMAKLALGDEVLTVGPDGTLRYDKVYLFSSRRAGAAQHALPAGLAGWELLPAGDLRLGDAVLVARDGQAAPAPAVVTGIEDVASDVGVYNPHTRAGAIVVDGVVASELTSFVPRWAAQPYLLRATAAALHAVFAALPRSADARIAAMLSGLARGGPGDAIVDRNSFLHAPTSVLA